MSQRNKIFITGAEGFIGSHLTEKLVNEGFSVKALVLYNSFNSNGWLDTIDPKIKKNIEIVYGDIRDQNNIRSYMKDCEIVFHLAALIAIPYSYISPESYIETNVKGTLNVLLAARDNDIINFINTSTSEVYGSAIYAPIDESHPFQPQSPYSASKISADQISISFFKSFNMPVNIIRPFNTYGPRQSARAVIPTIITQLLNKNKKIKLGDTRPTRDFNYIDDTVSGFISAINVNKFGETFNIGSNYEVSIKETFKIISKIIGHEPVVETDSERLRPKNSEVNRLLSNNQKALEILNWKPNFNNIDGFKRGLKNTIEWFKDKNNIQLYKSDEYNI
tara:strand:- start:4328 stop:5332 length:1005 start_codon:yes stop_codon:yes gene_type:complete